MHNAVTTSESDAGCNVFSKNKAELRKRQKMGGCEAINTLQPIIKGDRNAKRDTKDTM